MTQTSSYGGDSKAPFVEFPDLDALLDFTRNCPDQKVVLAIFEYDGVEEIVVENYDCMRE